MSAHERHVLDVITVAFAFSVTVCNKRKVTLALHYEQIEVKERLQLFGADSFVLQFAF
jgi:hypothetical protein